jgi:OmpA-OmpF porin, OOP family
MKMLTALLALLAAAGVGAVSAAEAAGTPSWSAPVCQVGLHGDQPAGLDQDGDGIPDSEDWCSGSAAGAKVQPNGCALGEIDVACDQGIPEPKPRVVPTAVSKSARDTDADGVPDEDDRCPGTPKGAETDDNGCVKIEKVVLRGVNFATGSAKLLPAAGDTLRTVAGAMKANEKLEVEIGGHTDSVGDESKNQGLSERRAKAVKEFLVKEGVDEDRLSTKGYGESQPADTNDTAAGRANNRRVGFKITDS